MPHLQNKKLTLEHHLPKLGLGVTTECHTKKEAEASVSKCVWEKLAEPRETSFLTTGLFRDVHSLMYVHFLRRAVVYGLGDLNPFSVE